MVKGCRVEGGGPDGGRSRRMGAGEGGERRREETSGEERNRERIAKESCDDDDITTRLRKCVVDDACGDAGTTNIRHATASGPRDRDCRTASPCGVCWDPGTIHK